MKPLSYLLVILSSSFLISCSGGGKKVLVMASGEINIKGNTITLQPGNTHNEASFVPGGDSVTVVSPSGSTGFSVKEKGLYLLNLKKDTVVGSYQHVGTDNAQQVISQEDLRNQIDSMYRLMLGVNMNPQARNYNIPPFTIQKITDNTNAEVIGPYVSIPDSFDPSSEHEVYKFYTNKEIWEIIQKAAKAVQ